MAARRVLFASPPEPCGASWLVNCLLELGVAVHYKPVVDRVWRTTTPRPGPEAMWRVEGGEHRLHERAHELRKWLPVLSRVPSLRFRDDVVVDYVQDLATPADARRHVIFFVRDPRDAIHSMYRRQGPRMSFEEFVAFPDARTLLDRIDLWNLRACAWSDLERVRVFRFEDYKEDAEDTLTRALQWLEIETTREERLRAVAESTYEKARAAEERYRATRPLPGAVANRAGRVGEWRERGLAEFGAEVENRAAAGLARCGYGVVPSDGGAGFLGAAPLASLAVFDGLIVPPELARQAADAAARARSLDALRPFLARIAPVPHDLGHLADAGLPAFEVRQLLDSLATLSAAQGLGIEPLVAALRPPFEDGESYHVAQVHELLLRWRARRDAGG